MSLSKVLILICVVTLSACSLTNQQVDNADAINIDWKLNEDEILAYHTSMNQSLDRESQIDIDFEQLLDGSLNLDDIYEQINELQVVESAEMVSLLRLNSDNNINVQMILDNVDFTDANSDNPLQESFNQLMENMEGTVQLRGEITPEGSIASFYNQPRQRNLLSIFFELPAQSVSVGDRWEIDVNCLSVGGGFIVSRAERINQVELSSISETPEGETIATINYIILEAIEGVSDSLLSEETISVSMTCSYLGRGQFLIEEGRWNQLAGEFNLSSTGFMDSNSISYFTLRPMQTIPAEYENMP